MNYIRTRFAPSPTGYLHIGGLRTALYNYLFAKKNKGKFILRIEDTDQNRLVDNAILDLMETLKVCGMDYDEGPNISGDFGPYIQSERIKLYTKHIIQLIEEGKAYPCFFKNENKDELNPEFNIQIAKQRMKDELFVVKFKISSDRRLKAIDLVRDEINFDLSLIEDPIILKSDGYPTYHFANVIDDHYMEISHVIRGEEWLSSLPKHILIYEAFGWEIPEFCHLPLILNPDKTKLSKRQGDVAVEDFIKKGYLSECLINFVALLGWHPHNDEEIFNLNSLMKIFSLDRINKSGAVFDIDKLNWMNKQYIKKISNKSWLDLVKKEFSKNNKNVKNTELFENVINYIKPRVNNVSEALPEILSFLQFKDSMEILNDQYNFKELGKFWIEELDQLIKPNEEDIKNIIEKTSTVLNIKGKNLFLPLRLSLIGKEHGPDLYSIINILGKDESIKRIKLNIA